MTLVVRHARTALTGERVTSQNKISRGAKKKKKRPLPRTTRVRHVRGSKINRLQRTSMTECRDEQVSLAPFLQSSFKKSNRL